MALPAAGQLLISATAVFLQQSCTGAQATWCSYITFEKKETALGNTIERTWLLRVSCHVLRAVVAVPAGVALAEADAALAMAAALVHAHCLVYLCITRCAIIGR